MSPYAEELAHARLEALRQLIDAMRAAEDPAEKRRCAVAIFNAPDPCEIDDTIELEDDDDNPDTSDDAPQPPGLSDAGGEESESRGYTAAITSNSPSSVPSVLFAPSTPPRASLTPVSFIPAPIAAAGRPP